MTMANKLHAAEAIERLAVQYQQMIEVAEILKKIGTVEQATKEAEQAAAAARAEAAAARADADLAKADVKKAKDKAAALLDKAADDVAAMIAEGSAKAAGIEADAITAANVTRDQAKRQASEMLIAATAQKNQLVSDFKALSQQCVDLDNEIKAKTEEVELLESRLAKAQAQIAKLLG
jgi:hypothetical protein